MHQVQVFSCISIAISTIALVLNIIGLDLVRKHGATRTNQNLILLHFSIIQIPMLSVNLNYWISIMLDVPEESLHMKWTASFLISGRIPIVLAIIILTIDRFCSIKYSLTYRNSTSRGRINLALIITWMSWITGFVILFLLGAKRLHHVLTTIVIPVKDSVLIFFIFSTYCYIYCRITKRNRTMSTTSARSQQAQSGSRQILCVSTAIVISYLFLILLPDLTLSIALHHTDQYTSILISNSRNMLNTCYMITIPLTYIFLHRNMRRTFVEKIMSCCRIEGAIPSVLSTIRPTEREMQVTNF